MKVIQAALGEGGWRKIKKNPLGWGEGFED